MPVGWHMRSCALGVGTCHHCRRCCRRWLSSRQHALPANSSVSTPSYAIKKKDEIERVAKANR